jgi:hypothetical protein
MHTSAPSFLQKVLIPWQSRFQIYEYMGTKPMHKKKSGTRPPWTWNFDIHHLCNSNTMSIKIHARNYHFGHVCIYGKRAATDSPGESNH